ncbi:MAG: helix-turn-helix domain-containing protein [Geminicoccaceae bacterium]
MITHGDAARGFAAVGSQARIEVLLVLVRAGESGLNVGDIGVRTGIPASTLAHHLRFLADAGLIRQRREGRQTINVADYDRLRALSVFLLHQCCADEKMAETTTEMAES